VIGIPKSRGDRMKWYKQNKVLGAPSWIEVGLGNLTPKYHAEPSEKFLYQTSQRNIIVTKRPAKRSSK